MPHTRGPNAALRGCMAEAGWNGPALAAALQKVARESGFSVGYDRTTVAHWLSGTQPRPPGPQLLEEAFARRLGRPVSRGELGLQSADPALAEESGPESADALTGLRRLHSWPNSGEPQDETFQPPLFQIRLVPAPRPAAGPGPAREAAPRPPQVPSVRRARPAGVGGSRLSLGSAAGGALLGQARGVYTFRAHHTWAWAIALGYAAGIGAHLLLNRHLF